MAKNMRIIISLTFFLIFSISIIAQENGRATGRILDKKTGAPLENANVYLVNTTLGSSTSKTGRYAIENISPGKYVIIVSVVGYAREFSSIQIMKNRSTKVDFDLDRQPVLLDEVTIKATNEWEDNLETFTEKLLGNSRFLTSCEVIIPKNLYLHIDEDDNLIAKSDSLIIVINNGLGYKIDIEIKRFSWDITADVGTYILFPRFEEFETDDAELQTQWQENREKAYLGSFRHFLTMVAQDSIMLSGYKIFSGSMTDIRFNRMNPVSVDQMDIEFEEEYVRLCPKLPYMVRNNYLNHLNKFDLRQNQNCVIVAEECLLFNYNGIMYNPEKIQLSGYWANQRIADALPYNYITK